MEIIEFDLNYKIQNNDTKSVIALGKFESLHLGHQEVLSKAYNDAKNNKLNFIVMLYSDYDGFKMENNNNVFNFETRKKMLEQYSPNYYLVFEKNKKNYSISADVFFKFLKNNLNVETVYVGENFKIKEIGDIDNFDNLLEIKKIPLVRYENQIISTTTIKTMLENGEVDNIKQLLGYDYFINGIVVHGHGKGKEIGFPTVNIESINTLTPKQGIYISEVFFLGKKYKGVTSIGTKPTFNDDDKIYIETHILNFNNIDLYDENISITLLKFIREQVKFSEITQLINEIKNDIEKTNTFFRNLIK